MKEVEVIASFQEEDLPVPHRIRLAAEDESLLVVKINSVLYADKDIAYKVIKYKCECMIQDTKRVVDLYFYYNRLKWYMRM